MHAGLLRALMGLRRPFHRFHALFHSEMQLPTYPAKIRKMVRWSPDPVRFAAMALALERVRSDNIPGAIAEIGVHRGYCSKFLHEQLPERRLYLFDTFRGFPGSSDSRFRDTSIEFVKARLGNLGNVQFRVGVFPDTAKGLEQEAFSFVLFDADKYDVAMASFEFFYPRLSTGGFYMLHDFNSEESDGDVRRAVESFLRGKRELLTEIPDHGGTALFRRL
jgi:O-methyltransferase